MHKSIRFKLFLILMTTTLLIVAGMYAFTRWSVTQGFSELIASRQQERVNNMIEGLSDYYASHQSWDELAKDKQQWLNLLLQSNPRNIAPNWRTQALAEPGNLWPPAINPEQDKRKFTPLELRVMLLDADKKIVFGREETLPELLLTPIGYQGKIIGYLGLAPGKTVNHVSEISFMERQSESFIWIALIMIALSAFLALLLAYMLGGPLKRITGAVKTLAAGNYAIRLTMDSNDELGHLARDFNEMAEALDQAEQSRRRWIADISHELRTPLAVLRGELEALQDGIRPLNAAAVDSLFGEVLRLHRLTDDLYQLALSDQGALTYRKELIHPVEILAEDLEAMKPAFQNKQIDIGYTNTLPDSVTIYADPDRLSQLFKNLLTNSLNYTDRQGRLEISVTRQAEHVRFIFADSAPGVPEDVLPKLFDRFYRQDSSRNRHRGGAGLGLAICWNIVQAHHGGIQALPSGLQGVKIEVEFPISA